MYKRLIVIAAALLCAASAWAQKNKLNVFIWSEYIDPKIIQNFEKEFDCKVTVDLYEDNESMVAKLQGGGTSLYDIVVPSDYIIPSMISQKLLAPLRMENVPNLKNVDPKFANREYDPGTNSPHPISGAPSAFMSAKRRVKPSMKPGVWYSTRRNKSDRF